MLRCTSTAHCASLEHGVTAAVVDDCGAACGPGDVQLNSFVFRELSSKPAAPSNAFPVAWQLTPSPAVGHAQPSQAPAPEQPAYEDDEAGPGEQAGAEAGVIKAFEQALVLAPVTGLLAAPANGLLAAPLGAPISLVPAAEAAATAAPPKVVAFATAAPAAEPPRPAAAAPPAEEQAAPATEQPLPAAEAAAVAEVAEEDLSPAVAPAPSAEVAPLEPPPPEAEAPAAQLDPRMQPGMPPPAPPRAEAAAPAMESLQPAAVGPAAAGEPPAAEPAMAAQAPGEEPPQLSAGMPAAAPPAPEGEAPPAMAVEALPLPTPLVQPPAPAAADPSAPAAEMPAGRAEAEPGPTAAAGGERFSGTARAGSWPSWREFGDLACGLSGIAPNFQSDYGAVKLDLHSRGVAACGRCIKATCANASACSAGTGAALFLVLDDCGHCGGGDLLMSPNALRLMAGVAEGAASPPSLAVEWGFADCGRVAWDIYMHVLPGGSQHYQAVTFSNTGQPLAGARIAGRPLSHSDHRWVWQGDGGRSELAGLLTIELTSMAGKPCLHTAWQTISAQVASLDSQALPGIRFAPPGAAAD
ncbi:hypothetical protein CHLNCDRAFT_143878 [Chlorella variabilis]|uniref:Expansin-like EG45 domain-containing protein n=1 Tax=Chlorella variabilis TaxID=554065 RepID=E1ZAN1_CHLVA|nr:hypothetical protein CHLNCDRAFT_143878 [Chlorella variabilis]EFN57288.1 hypothetical protein CHLNCDRAFT_143878 [Chlorella variabilis]|eukprot:XP_005849390.1 hypothetical protein CHLNCDRAFT_143878 [Chlorella variabilis]